MAIEPAELFGPWLQWNRSGLACLRNLIGVFGRELTLLHALNQGAQIAQWRAADRSRCDGARPFIDHHLRQRPAELSDLARRGCPQFVR